MQNSELEDQMLALEQTLRRDIRENYLERWNKSLKLMMEAHDPIDVQTTDAVAEFFVDEFVNLGAIIVIETMSNRMFQSTHFSEALDRISMVIERATGHAETESSPASPPTSEKEGEEEGQ